MSKMHSTSLLSTPWSFWTGILSQVSKNDDEKTLLLRVNLALYYFLNTQFVRPSAVNETALKFYRHIYIFFCPMEQYQMEQYRNSLSNFA